jgi:FlaA1/EpsC-like NDP-sugar epimerase
MTIPEAVQLVIQAGTFGEGGEVFVLDMGEPVKIIDLARDLIELSGFKPGEDIEIEITGLRPGEKLYEELLNDNENNIATEHERIFITRLEEIDEFALRKGIADLEEAASKGNSVLIIKLLTRLIPTYQPNRDYLKEISYIKEAGIEEKVKYVGKTITGEIASAGERDFS